jgi:hypothetical protein
MRTTTPSKTAIGDLSDAEVRALQQRWRAYDEMGVLFSMPMPGGKTLGDLTDVELTELIRRFSKLGDQ